MDSESNKNQHKLLFEKIDELKNKDIADLRDRTLLIENTVATMNDVVKSNTALCDELKKSNDLCAKALFPNADLRTKGLIQVVEDQNTLLNKHSHILKYSGIAVIIVWAIVSNFDKFKALVE